jgi:prepilin-type N-terminal cleavage/methylation domain-containing protein
MPVKKPSEKFWPITMRRNLKYQKGVTLIELVMAIVILTVVAIPTASMIGAQIQGMAESSNITAAGNAGRFAMEKLNNTPYASITTGVSLPANSLAVGYYTAKWDVVLSGTGAGEKKEITMRVVRTGTTPVLATFYTTFCTGTTTGT